MADRARAGACLAGVVVLTGAWSLAGLATDDFDPVRQSTSQLQRDGAATAVVMTSAFVVFGTSALAFARLLPREPRVALLLVGLATLGAAASPLGEVRGGRQDALHLAFGATGYAALSVLPLLTAPHLTGRARALAVAAGVVTSACLLGTVPAHAVSGALQRAGFLTGHRVRAALGDRAGDVEHVVSTAAPGLPAKPVTDLQLVVPDVADEAAWLPHLEAAGYVLRVREPGHAVAKAAPPLSDANVHLYGPDDPETARVRRFSDLLRADPEARQRYEDVKRSLAGRVWPTVDDYAAAKRPVVRERALLS